MALRVLLADESPTIKKVMQISLQDFAVEIRSINLGTDVIDAVQDFKPDIIFIDILLQKKSGYEVAKELKSDPKTTNVPVIMLWNGFMNLDEAKFKESNADDKLEKPFDATILRNTILKYVNKTQTNPVAEHIQPPPIKWEEEESFKVDPDKTAGIPMPKLDDNKPENEEEKMSWNMDQFSDLPSLEEIDQEENEESGDQFQPMKLAEMKTQGSTNTKEDSISKFTLDIPNDENDSYNYTDDDNLEIDTSSFLWSNDDKNEEKDDWQSQAPQAPKEKEENPSPPAKISVATNNKEEIQQAGQKNVPEITDAEIEAYIRKYCQESIERLAKDLVPKMAKKIIQEEINRLMEENEAET